MQNAESIEILRKKERERELPLSVFVNAHSSPVRKGRLVGRPCGGTSPPSQVSKEETAIRSSTQDRQPRRTACCM